MSLVVICAGGHARVVIEALRSRAVFPVAVTDDDSRLFGSFLAGIPIVGSQDAILAMEAASVELAIGIGNCASRSSPGLSTRRELFGRFSALGYAFPVIAHISAVFASDVFPGQGAQIMAGAVIQPGARIGRNVLVNTRAVVEHDCQIGDHSHIAPGAVLCGGVSVGEGAHVGAGAIVLGGVNVGAGSVIAAGAVVASDVEAGGFTGSTLDRRITKRPPLTTS